ncbi:MAG: polyprenyl synthetase family protein [bacterium]
MTRKNLDSLLSSRKSRIDNHLEKILKTKDYFAKNLYEAMHYSVSAGGKRLRPAIMLLIGDDLFAVKNHRGLLTAACSVEMIHTYSLIHDDLPAMDNDDFRRGLPTLHKKYDEATAILAGDALFSLAIETFLNADNFKKENLLKGISELMSAIGTGGMVAGQFVDTKASLFERNFDTLKYIHMKKTASLIRASFTLPAILLGKGENTVKKLSKLGAAAGMLFQIVDDIIDVTQTSKVLGKTARKDLKQNKLTYVSLFGLEEAKRMAEKEADKALRASRALDFKSDSVEIMIDYFHKRIK